MVSSSLVKKVLPASTPWYASMILWAWGLILWPCNVISNEKCQLLADLWSTWRARALTRSARANQKTCRDLKSSLAARVFAYDRYWISLDDDPLRLNGSELLGAVSNTWGRLRYSPPQLFTSLIVSVWVGLAGGQLHMLRQRGSRIAGKRASCKSFLALLLLCMCA